jgi:2-dehydro-3-deoxyphosphogluconate aldolase/(4S)-4-hydroxy-2-oxoglutarate aldolase
MSVVETRLREILASGPVVPVYTPGSAREAVEVARALVRGGIRAIEITLRNAVALDAVRAVVAEVPEALVGAGTVLTPAQLVAALEAGAMYLVSPGSTPALLDAAQANAAPLLPGTATASEIMRALDAGFTTLKFFPAEAVGGAAAVGSYAAPLAQAKFCPTGGITLQTAPTYLALPNVLCLGGSWLTPKAALAAQDWDLIEALAREATGLRK